MISCGTIWHDTILCNEMRYKKNQHDTVRYVTTQEYNKIGYTVVSYSVI